MFLCSWGFSFIFFIKASTSDLVPSKRFLVCKLKQECLPQCRDLSLALQLTGRGWGPTALWGAQGQPQGRFASWAWI